MLAHNVLTSHTGKIGQQPSCQNKQQGQNHYIVESPETLAVAKPGVLPEVKEGVGDSLAIAPAEAAIGKADGKDSIGQGERGRHGNVLPTGAEKEVGVDKVGEGDKGSERMECPVVDAGEIQRKAGQ